MYPIVAYSGLASDRREILFANLSDDEYPQQILHLPDDCQLVCFVGSSTYSSELYMLLEKQDELFLFILEKRQPFKKQRIGNPDKHDFELKLKPLKNSLKMQSSEILQAEYMFVSNEDLLVTRTVDAIFAIFENSPLRKLSSSLIKEIKHPMQRGYSDTIFWVEEISDKKNQLMGVRFEEKMESTDICTIEYKPYTIPDFKIQEFSVQMRESEYSTISYYR